MMGPRQEAQASLFYEFSLEDHVPHDHLLQSIDRHLDLSSIPGHLAEFYSHTGRPSVDPDLMIRMLLVGYCFGIRSERRLRPPMHRCRVQSEGTGAAQESCDALRAPQAHPWTGSPPITGAMRRSRRIHPRRRRPKPSETPKAQANCARNRMKGREASHIQKKSRR